MVSAVELQLLGSEGSLGAIIQTVLTIALPVVLLIIIYFVVKAAVKKGMKEVMVEKDSKTGQQAEPPGKYWLILQAHV